MNNKVLINNLKLIKAVGKNHNSGQVVLSKVHLLVHKDHNLVCLFNEALIMNGLESRYSALITVSKYVAQSAVNPDKKQFLPFFRATFNNLLDSFTPFDRYVSYHIDNGKVTYSKATLDKGLKVANDLIKDLK